MKTVTKAIRTGSVVGLSLAAMAGSAWAAGPTCEGGTINIGSVSTITGPVDFSAGPNATAAYFDA